jgi:hypothetical protein
MRKAGRPWRNEAARDAAATVLAPRRPVASSFEPRSVVSAFARAFEA